MKVCRKCGIEKELIEFHKWKNGKDGLCLYCKKCISKERKEFLERNKTRLLVIWEEQRKKKWKKTKDYNTKYYEKNCEKIKNKQSLYNFENKELINKKQRIYTTKNRCEINKKRREFSRSEKGRHQSKKYYEKTKDIFREKRNARNKLRYAVKIGKIKRPEFCEKCFEKAKVESHHDDYDKPLDVIWVCASCHRKIHFNKEK